MNNNSIWNDTVLSNQNGSDEQRLPRIDNYVESFHQPSHESLDTGNDEPVDNDGANPASGD